MSMKRLPIKFDFDRDEGIDFPQLTLLFPHITFSLTVRDLGLSLDSELTLSQHVNSIARSCYYQLRQLRVVSRSLSLTMQLWSLFMSLLGLLVELTTVPLYLLAFPLGFSGD